MIAHLLLTSINLAGGVVPKGTSTTVLIFVALLSGTVIQALLVAALDAYKLHQKTKTEDFERDKAIQSAPLVQESLALGNFDKAITIQQTTIHNLEKHINFQDTIIEDLREDLVKKEANITKCNSQIHKRDLSIAAQEVRIETLTARVAELEKHNVKP